jgi:hypothetical protein
MLRSDSATTRGANGPLYEIRKDEEALVKTCDP